MSDLPVGEEGFKTSRISGALRLSGSVWIALGIGLMLSVCVFIAANGVRVDSKTSWHTWGLLLGCVLLSGLVANYISTVTRHSKYRKELTDRLFVSTHSLAVEAEQRKQLVQTLLESEERFRELFDSMSSGVIMYKAVDDGADFTVIGMNQASSKITNLTEEASLGRKLAELFPAVAETGLLDAIRRVWRSDQAEDFPITFYDDGRISLWFKSRILKLSTGEIVVVYDDVTDLVEAEQTLRASEARYRTMVDSQVEAVCRWQPDTTLTYVNENYAKLFEMTPGKMIGREFLEFVPEDMRPKRTEYVEALVADARTDVVERALTCPDGTVRYMEWTNCPVFDGQGNLVEFQSVGHDVTHRKVAEIRLRESESRYRSMIDRSADGIVVLNPQGEVLFANLAAETLFKQKAAEIPAGSLGLLTAKEMGEIDIKAADGSTRTVEVILTETTWQESPARLATLRDVTERKISRRRLQETNRQLEELAATDVLTELPNRRRLMEVLEREVAKNQRHGSGIGLALIDIDGFKAINQIYGMELGDRALKEVADLIRRQIRKSDFVARFEGDQFVVLLPINQLTQLDKIVEKLRRKIGEHLISDEKKTFRLQASAGLALTKANDGNTANSLLSMADEALLAAKRFGGNCTKTWQEATSSDAAIDTAESEQTRHLRKQIASLMHKSKELSVQSIWSLVQALEARDAYTRGHSENVTRYAVGIARTLGLDAEEIGVIRRAAVIHDIGKIGVPDNVLRKEGPLTDEERIRIESHVLTGVRILQETRFLDRENAYVRCHHERWDGHGYPEGISGSAIPLGARILAVADSLDAITSNRVYRERRGLAEALDILSAEAGKQFDPLIIDALRQWVDEASQRMAANGKLTPEQLLKTERAATAVDMDLLGEQVLPN